MPLPGLTTKRPAFVQIGWIKKGAAKPASRPGKDLDEQMRVEFLEGQEQYQEQFVKHYGTLTPDKINIWFPFPTAGRVWDAYYEAYQANQRMVAQAGSLPSDPEGPIYYKYLWSIEEKKTVIVNWKHRETGEHVLCDPELPIEYSYIPKGNKKPKNVSLTLKPYGRLQVMIRELDVIAFMTLRTTSIADIQYISSELAGFSEMVEGRPEGLRGVPFVLYRKPEMRNIPGKDQRAQKWFVHLATDAEWVASARIQALGTNGDTLGLEAGDEIDEFVEEVEGEVIEVEPKVSTSTKEKPKKKSDAITEYHLYAKKIGMDTDNAVSILQQCESDPVIALRELKEHHTPPQEAQNNGN